MRFGSGSRREWIKGAGWKQSSQALKRVRVHSPMGQGERRLVGSVVHLGQYLIVMEKIGGEWKIVQHFSLNAGETPSRELNCYSQKVPCHPSSPHAMEGACVTLSSQTGSGALRWRNGGPLRRPPSCCANILFVGVTNLWG